MPEFVKIADALASCKYGDMEMDMETFWCQEMRKERK